MTRPTTTHRRNGRLELFNLLRLYLARILAHHGAYGLLLVRGLERKQLLLPARQVVRQHLLVKLRWEGARPK